MIIKVIQWFPGRNCRDFHFRITDWKAPSSLQRFLGRLLGLSQDTGKGSFLELYKLVHIFPVLWLENCPFKLEVRTSTTWGPIQTVASSAGPQLSVSLQPVEDCKVSPSMKILWFTICALVINVPPRFFFFSSSTELSRECYWYVRASGVDRKMAPQDVQSFLLPPVNTLT